MSTNIKYPVAMRAIHWIMALLIFSLIGVGWYMAGLPDSDATKYGFYPWHKSFGVVVLLLLFVRIVVRIKNAKSGHIPAEPEVLKAWEKLAAKLGHLGLYLLMFAVPLSGYIMSDAHPKSGVDFFVGKLPNIFPKSEELSGLAHSLHEPFAWALLALVIIHVAGALKHRFIDSKEADVLNRML